MKDKLGLTLSGSNETSAALYEEALHELQCYVGDPVALTDRAIAESPGFVMAHALKGFL